MKKGTVTIGWFLGLAGAFIVSTFSYALRNENINATQTADITNIKEQFSGLKDTVAKEVSAGVKDGVKQVLKEMSYNEPEANIPAVEAKSAPLIKGENPDGSPKQ